MRVENPVKLPTKEVLTLAINGLKRKIKVEADPDKKHRLKVIKAELRWLKDQL